MARRGTTPKSIVNGSVKRDASDELGFTEAVRSSNKSKGASDQSDIEDSAYVVRLLLNSFVTNVLAGNGSVVPSIPDAIRLIQLFRELTAEKRPQSIEVQWVETIPDASTIQ